jgi:pimeloyl-ACP methyl ester carboxylesterase
VGTSRGSRVAVDAALAEPGRVAGLVLAGPGLSGREASPELLEALNEVEVALATGDVDLANELELRIWIDGNGRSRPVDPAVRAAIGEMNRAVIEREIRGETTVELPPRRRAVDSLGSLACPVLVILGECDQPQCVETARMIVEGAPRAELLTLAETAHVPSVERPEKFSRAVLDFLVELG